MFDYSMFDCYIFYQALPDHWLIAARPSPGHPELEIVRLLDRRLAMAAIAPQRVFLLSCGWKASHAPAVREWLDNEVGSYLWEDLMKAASENRIICHHRESPTRQSERTTCNLDMRASICVWYALNLKQGRLFLQIFSVYRMSHHGETSHRMCL